MKHNKTVAFLFIILIGVSIGVPIYTNLTRKDDSDYSGRSAHALKRVQRTGIAVQQSSAAVQPRPLGMG